MPHAKFNWAARPLPANEGRFQLGETLRLSDTVLTKGECGQGCTLEGTTHPPSCPPWSQPDVGQNLPWMEGMHVPILPWVMANALEGLMGAVERPARGRGSGVVSRWKGRED